MGAYLQMAPVGGDPRHRRRIGLPGASSLAVADGAIGGVCSRKLTARTFGERGAPGA
jgi:hypothetical protein